MSKTSRVVENVNLGADERGGERVLEVTVRYEKGGMNYFSGSSSPRGYYLSATPMTILDGMKSFMLFSGGKLLLESAARFNAKKLDALAATAKSHPRYEALKAAASSAK